MIQDNDREIMSEGDDDGEGHSDNGDGKEVPRQGSGSSHVQGEALQRLNTFHLTSSHRICQAQI